jgi:putative solute:sodium symporter small subunit
MNDLSPLRRQQKRYWKQTLWLTGALLAIWVLVTFAAPYFSQQLNQWSFLGLPLGYFIAAQGSLIVYIVLIGLYAFLMNRLDRRFGVDEQ